MRLDREQLRTSSDPDAVRWRKTVIAEAEAEFHNELFRAAVEAEKARIRARQIPWWQRIFNRLFN